MRLVGAAAASSIALFSKSLYRSALHMSSSPSPPSTWLAGAPTREFFFGPHVCKVAQAFYESPLSICIVNIKPIVPGHVLVIPKRVCARFADMTPEEVVDLWTTVHYIGPILERYHLCTALNLAIQDGKESGQSVAHVHVHILPRKKGDFRRNDDVYGELNSQCLGKAFSPHGSGEEGGEGSGRPKSPPRGMDPADDAARSVRTEAAMAEEAAQLRLLFPPAPAPRSVL